MSRLGVAAWAAWMVVAGLLFAAWMVLLATDSDDAWHVASLLALTGCATSAVAATLHIRLMGCRVARLIRVTSGLDDEEVPGVRSLR